MKRIIIHWTAGSHKASSVDKEHYHMIVNGDGTVVNGDHKIEDNLSTADGVYAAHTKGANTGAIGVAMAGMLGDMTFNRDRMEAACGQGHITATDLADWLVRALAMPFRNAHHVTGTLVAKAEELGLQVADLSLEQLQEVEPKIDASVFDVLTPKASMASRLSAGGTAPKRVAEALSVTERDLTNHLKRFG